MATLNCREEVDLAELLCELHPWAEMVRYARGRMRLLRKHPSTFSVACFVPMLFLLGLLTGPLVTLFSPLLCSIYHFALAAYGLVVLAASCGIAWQRGELKLLPLLPFTFAAIHLGTGAGAIGELIGWITRGEPKFVLKSMPREAVLMDRPPEKTGSPISVALEEP